jgi:hypothetical protein
MILLIIRLILLRNKSIQQSIEFILIMNRLILKSIRLILRQNETLTDRQMIRMDR